MIENSEKSSSAWLVPLTVFATVLLAQLALVAAAGTDIPFHDQWDVEGKWFYPAAQEGSLHLADFFRPHNEHRIVWTHLLNFWLFRMNGNQWDPLVQLVAGAFLHATCAAFLARFMARGLGPVGRGSVAAAVFLANLPVAGWHNALWGFQSQVYFALLFALLAFAMLDGSGESRGRMCMGWLMVLFALLAMGPGALVLVALLGLVGIMSCEAGKLDRATVRNYWPIVPLLILAAMLRESVPEHAVLHASSLAQFVSVAGRVLAWPHVGQPLAAIALNIPLMILVFGRIRGLRRPAAAENFVLLLGGWAIAIALATAWSRGGGDELADSVPSRYVDLVMLLPLANGWCVLTLVREAAPHRRVISRLVAGIWMLFLFVGWLGLSAQMMRGIVVPRARDLLAPVRLAVAFQASGDAAVFAGQPRLLVPHPNLTVVQRVLADPRMKSSLPPSLQAAQPMGPLSRAARKILGR